MRPNAPLLFLLALLVASSPAPAGVLQVQVERAAVHQARSKFSPVLATLAYGERIEATADGDWFAVALPDGRAGHVHRSALVEPARVTGVDRTGEVVNPKALAAAVRGFQDESERRARSEGGFDFSAVDRLEALNDRLTPERLETFRRRGRLGEFQEAAR